MEELSMLLALVGSMESVEVSRRLNNSFEPCLEFPPKKGSAVHSFKFASRAFLAGPVVQNGSGLKVFRAIVRRIASLRDVGSI